MRDPEPDRRTILAGFLAIATLPSPLRGAALHTVKSTIFSDTIFTLPLWIAMEKGFFAEEGLAYLLERSTLQQTIAGLFEGSVPVGLVGAENVFLDKPGQDRLTIIAGGANRLPHFLIAQPRFRQIADLKGATFGVISETEGTTLVIRKMAALAGLGPSDYKIEAVGSAPARVKLMDDGVIDAALQPFPLCYEAEAKGFRNLGWSGSVEPDWQFSAIVANRDWLRSNRDVAVRILRAAVRGRHFIDARPDEAALIAARLVKTTTAAARRALDDTRRLRVMDKNLKWSAAGLRRVYEVLSDAGETRLERPFDLKGYVDPQPLFEAIASLRRRRAKSEGRSQ